MRTVLDTLHVCDGHLPTQDLLLDRGLPGDGGANPKGHRAKAETVGYKGFVEVEVFQPELWSIGSAMEIAATARDAALAHA